MSPRNDTTITLPRQKRRSIDPLDRMIAETLDDQLLSFARTNTPFSIPDIRDHLLHFPELDDADSVKLRTRVRDRLKTLENHRLVEQVGMRGKKCRLYRMTLKAPLNASVGQVPGSPVAGNPSSLPSPDSAELLTYLEQERHQLRTEMQASLSEAEHYQHLIAKYPDARCHIEPLLDATLESSGSLKGRLDANVNVRRALSNQATPKTEDNTEDLV